MGVLGWLNCIGMLGWLELACQTACTCLFKVRLGVLSKTLSHLWGKLNLPIFLFNVGLFILINMDSLMFLTLKRHAIAVWHANSNQPNTPPC